ncbi:MAG TPA: helicase HerA-like domain-containing protein, partial [Kiloniellales bacterium]|nr:helicase HerA-like domain-containing protein [Kiloniellales bacterium]
HALRAYTPREQKAVRTAAETFRANPKFSTEQAITELGVGEALVSLLGPKGVPAVVERVLIRPPASRIGPITPAERSALIEISPLKSRYEKPVDRESAYEVLKRRAGQSVPRQPQEGGGGVIVTRSDDRPRGGGRRIEDQKPAPRTRSSNRQSIGEAFAKSVVRSLGSGIGRSITRGILGSLFRK